jgi:prepilin-type N-terminal cleavage/methylation domain-containing protein
MKNSLKNNDGFTLIELIIVLAIITILGSIALPNFLNTSTKARLKADIQSTRTIENAKQLYETETGDSISSSEANQIIKILRDSNYIKKEYSPQTDKAAWIIDKKSDENNIKLDISSCANSVKKNYDNLNREEKEYIINNN